MLYCCDFALLDLHCGVIICYVVLCYDVLCFGLLLMCLCCDVMLALF